MLQWSGSAIARQRKKYASRASLYSSSQAESISRVSTLPLLAIVR
ncbi:MAG: hypothetical protein U0835_23090 [Isosphaeraceae bacterium]